MLRGTLPSPNTTRFGGPYILDKLVGCLISLPIFYMGNHKYIKTLKKAPNIMHYNCLKPPRRGGFLFHRIFTKIYQSYSTWTKNSHPPLPVLSPSLTAAASQYKISGTLHASTIALPASSLRTNPNSPTWSHPTDQSQFSFTHPFWDLDHLTCWRCIPSIMPSCLLASPLAEIKATTFWKIKKRKVFLIENSLISSPPQPPKGSSNNRHKH